MGALNPAYLFAKHLAADLGDRHLDGLSCAFRDGTLEWSMMQLRPLADIWVEGEYEDHTPKQP